MKIAVIGGGIAGLTISYRLVNHGFKVTLFEKENRLGGLASSFLLNGIPIERYYHFICLNDKNYINLLEELNLKSKLHWINTKMGQYYHDEIHPFSTALDLLRLKGFSLYQKLRFGFGILHSKMIRNWRPLENVPVARWLIHEFGLKSYNVIHGPLVKLKFGKYADQLSAAWMWARIRRLGMSRTKWTQKEILGYLEGGTEIIINKLAERIRAKGGEIFLNTAVKQVKRKNQKIEILLSDRTSCEYDYVVSTIALSYFARMVPDLPNDYLMEINKIKYIGVICLFLQLKNSISDNFWINISDPDIELAGIIEYSNLNPLQHLKGGKIIYLPQYLSAEDDQFYISDKKLFEKYCGYLKKINPNFKKSWIKKHIIFRDQYAQPICDRGFTHHTPGHRTPIQHLFITDSNQLHPDDRSVSNSIGLGDSVTKMILSEIEKTNSEENSNRRNKQISSYMLKYNNRITENIK